MSYMQPLRATATFLASTITSLSPMRYGITVFVPTTHSAVVRTAMAEGGAGSEGPYDSCSFTARGVGRFRPLPGAQPHIGTIGTIEEVEEDRIETECMSEERLPVILAAIRAAHPYEWPAIHVTPLIEVDHQPKPSIAAAEPAISIVIGGLDGTGKSTVCAMLAERLGGVVLRTPPEVMRSFRGFFDLPANAEYRRGYYMAGNFLAGKEMEETTAKGTPVVMDRYFDSTRSYMLGLAEAPLPASGDPAYDWPEDLARPTYSFFLTVPEEVRLARRSGRTEVPETAEEARLRKEPEACARINEAYRRFGSMEVSALGSREEVCDRILAIVGKRKA